MLAVVPRIQRLAALAKAQQATEAAPAPAAPAIKRCHCRSRLPALGEDPTPANLAARSEEGTGEPHYPSFGASGAAILPIRQVAFAALMSTIREL